jgi:hypothetical protein
MEPTAEQISQLALGFEVYSRKRSTIIAGGLLLHAKLVVQYMPGSVLCLCQCYCMPQQAVISLMFQLVVAWHHSTWALIVLWG